MKKIILFIASITIIFFSACKKDPLDIPLGTISVSINDIKTTFNVQSKATTTNAAGYNILTIQGYKKDPAVSSTFMKLTITNPGQITGGSYSENIASGYTSVRINYFQSLIYSIGTAYVSYGSSSNPAKVNISSISGGTVKGSFQGEVHVPNSGGIGEKVVLSGGVFNVSF